MIHYIRASLFVSVLIAASATMSANAESPQAQTESREIEVRAKYIEVPCKDIAHLMKKGPVTAAALTNLVNRGRARSLSAPVVTTQCL